MQIRKGMRPQQVREQFREQVGEEMDQYHVLERYEADEALVNFLDQLLRSRGHCDAPSGIRGMTSQQLWPLVSRRKRRRLLDRALAAVELGGNAQLAIQALQVVPYCVAANNLLCLLFYIYMVVVAPLREKNRAPSMVRRSPGLVSRRVA
jgi:hypothetical protein